MEITSLDFLDSLAETVSTESLTNTLSSDANGDNSDINFLDMLGYQLDQLTEVDIPSEVDISPEEGIIPKQHLSVETILEADITVELEQGGEYLPVPAIVDRQQVPKTPAEPLLTRLHLSLTTGPASDVPLSSPQTDLSTSYPAPELSSTLTAHSEKVYSENLEQITKGIGDLPNHQEDVTKQISGFSQETRSGDSLATQKQTVATLQKPVGQPGWDQDLGSRIIWLVDKSRPSAELRLNPPQLGPVEVKIDINKDQANINFTAQNAQVREALESSIPKLREMLAAQNIQLNDAVVSQQSFAGHSHSHGKGPFAEQNMQTGTGSTEDGEVEVSENVKEEITLTSQGILSLYV